ncbi:MAG TPA: hypothetical protein VGA61_00175 [Anaerolineae bacterium]
MTNLQPMTKRENSGPDPAASLSHLVVRRAARPGWAVFGEKVLEALIYLCGISAIIFVLGIFFFVFKEAMPVLGNGKFSLTQFLTSDQWYPTSEINKRYGVLAMIAGTFSVTALAMLIAVPFGLGAAIYISEFCGPKSRKPSRSLLSCWRRFPVSSGVLSGLL